MTGTRKVYLSAQTDHSIQLLSESNSLQHLAAWLDWPLDREMIFGNGKC